MGTRTVQTCDNCGGDRKLDSSSDPDKRRGGWRELNSGGVTITICSDCIHHLVYAITGKKCRICLMDRETHHAFLVSGAKNAIESA